MKTLIVINSMSGNSEKVDVNKLIAKLAPTGETEVVYLKSNIDIINPDNFNRLIACGGDGTLNSVLNICESKEIEVYYLPFGTLNEKAKNEQKVLSHEIATVGNINDRLFSYVAAAGSFTEIGYRTKSKYKKRLKLLAYLFRVLQSYKIFDIPAEITANGVKKSGHYTLIMAIDNRRCFGFPFNRVYQPGQSVFQLLTIKTPKHKGLLGKIEMFFPMFRTFFIGYSKPYESKNISFSCATDIDISISESQNFCLDGELYTMDGTIKLRKKSLLTRINVINGAAFKKHRL